MPLKRVIPALISPNSDGFQQIISVTRNKNGSLSEAVALVRPIPSPKSLKNSAKRARRSSPKGKKLRDVIYEKILSAQRLGSGQDSRPIQDQSTTRIQRPEKPFESLHSSKPVASYDSVDRCRCHNVDGYHSGTRKSPMSESLERDPSPLPISSNPAFAEGAPRQYNELPSINNSPLDHFNTMGSPVKKSPMNTFSVRERPMSHASEERSHPIPSDTLSHPRRHQQRRKEEMNYSPTETTNHLQRSPKKISHQLRTQGSPQTEKTLDCAYEERLPSIPSDNLSPASRHHQGYMQEMNFSPAKADNYSQRAPRRYFEELKEIENYYGRASEEHLHSIPSNTIFDPSRHHQGYTEERSYVPIETANDSHSAPRRRIFEEVHVQRSPQTEKNCGCSHEERLSSIPSDHLSPIRRHHQGYMQEMDFSPIETDNYSHRAPRRYFEELKEIKNYFGLPSEEHLYSTPSDTIFHPNSHHQGYIKEVFYIPIETANDSHSVPRRRIFEEVHVQSSPQTEKNCGCAYEERLSSIPSDNLSPVSRHHQGYMQEMNFSPTETDNYSHRAPRRYFEELKEIKNYYGLPSEEHLYSTPSDTIFHPSSHHQGYIKEMSYTPIETANDPSGGVRRIFEELNELENYYGRASEERLYSTPSDTIFHPSSHHQGYIKEMSYTPTETANAPPGDPRRMIREDYNNAFAVQPYGPETCQASGTDNPYKANISITLHVV